MPTRVSGWSIQFPLLTEWEQLLYTLFLPAVILVAFLLWRKGRFVEFQYYAFLIALGYLVSYVGYIFVPARGPRYVLNPFQHIRYRACGYSACRTD